MDKVLFYILSTYPGTKYKDICISEIEFFYKGKKYEITNLEEAKKKYLKERINRLVQEIEFKGWDNVFEIQKMSDNMKKKLKKHGYKKNDIQIVEVKKAGKIKGVIYGYNKKTFNKLLKKYINKDENHEYYLFKPKKGTGKYLGRWKIDKYGNLWVKLFNGKWEISKYGWHYFEDQEGYYFKGTNMEFQGKNAFEGINV